MREALKKEEGKINWIILVFSTLAFVAVMIIMLVVLTNKQKNDKKQAEASDTQTLVSEEKITSEDNEIKQSDKNDKTNETYEEKVPYKWTELNNFDCYEILGRIYSGTPIKEGDNIKGLTADGYYLVKDINSNTYGLIDNLGNWIISPHYAKAAYYYEYSLYTGVDDWNYFTFDDSGFKYIQNLSDGYPNTICGWDIKNDKLCYGIDVGVDNIIYETDYKYDGTLGVRAWNVDSGYYTLDSEYGTKFAVVSQNQLLTDFCYDEVCAYENGLMAVQRDGKWGYVDSKGNEIIPCEYDGIRSYDYTFYEEKDYFAAACTDGFVVLAKNGEYALYDSKGKMVIPFGYYEALTEVTDGVLYAKKDGKWGVLDIKNIEPSLQQITNSIDKCDYLYKPIIEEYINIVATGQCNVEYAEDHSNSSEVACKSEIAMGVNSGYSEYNTSLGYAFKDIDGNGIDELLINDSTTNSLCAMYTIKNEQVLNLFYGWSRNRYSICSNGVIVNCASGGAAYTYYTYYRMVDASLDSIAHVFLIEDSIYYDGTGIDAPDEELYSSLYKEFDVVTYEYARL